LGSASPYLAGGIGHAEYDYDISGKDDGTSALVGPGFRYQLNDRWSSKVDLRWVHGLDNSEDDGLLTFALSYALGRTQEQAKPAVKASVVGDADNDGINDDIDQCPNTVAGAKVDSNGCAEKLTRTETIALNVTFATGSDKLTLDFMAEIEQVANFMRKDVKKIVVWLQCLTLRLLNSGLVVALSGILKLKKPP
jgi:OmpA-OmpF porin, OOP family